MTAIHISSTGSGSESQFTLESTIDQERNNYKTNGKANVISGSAVYAELNAKAGDVVTFDYFFDGGDYLPFDDFAFVSIMARALFASIKENGTTEMNQVFEYKLKSLTLKAQLSKWQSASLDVGDTAVTSALPFLVYL